MARNKLLWLVLTVSLTLNAIGLGWLTYRRLARAADRPHHYQTTRVSLFASLPAPRGAIVMLGDSHVDWGEWHELLGRSDVVNRGINRDRVRDLLARIDPVLAGQPAAIAIMAGTNDLLGGASIRDVMEPYRALVERIVAVSPDTRVVVQSVLPVRNRRGTTPEIIRALNAELEALCQHLPCTYLPLFEQVARDDGSLDPRFTFDGVHLNAAGYALWRDALAPLL